MNNILAGHTNSYHTYGLDESLAGIARAGYKYVELSAVRGWTEHIPLEASETQLDEIKAKLDSAGLKVASLSGHSDLTTAAGVVDGKKAVDLTQKFGVTIMNTAIGGHYSENEDDNGLNFFGRVEYRHEMLHRYQVITYASLGDRSAFDFEKQVEVGMELRF